MIMNVSPHVRCNDNSKKIMLNVVIALLPATIMGIVYFGLNALLIVALSVISAVVFEWLYLLILKKPFKNILKEFDFTSVVTGLIIGLILNSNAPWYVPILASLFAIVVVKMLFGGTGFNIVNPACAGRIFVFISFTIALESFTLPSINAINNTLITGATSLKSLLTDGTTLTNLDLFLGTGVAGCIGETCKPALLLGFIYLICTRTIDFKWPLISLITIGLSATMLEGFNFNYFLPSILSGGAMFACIFMATDYTTSPKTTLAQYIYYIVLGFLVALLRKVIGYEAISFAILLMNLLVPLFDKYFIIRPFGYKRVKKVK